MHTEVWVAIIKIQCKGKWKIQLFSKLEYAIFLISIDALYVFHSPDIFSTKYWPTLSQYIRAFPLQSWTEIWSCNYLFTYLFIYLLPFWRLVIRLSTKFSEVDMVYEK